MSETFRRFVSGLTVLFVFCAPLSAQNAFPEDVFWDGGGEVGVVEAEQPDALFGGLGGISTEITQLLNHVELVFSAIQEVQQLLVLLENLATIADLPARELFGALLAEASQLAEFELGMSVSNPGILDWFTFVLPGWVPVIEGIEKLGDGVLKYWTKTRRDTSAGAISAAQMIQGDYEESLEYLNDLRSASQVFSGDSKHQQMTQVQLDAVNLELAKLNQLTALMLQVATTESAAVTTIEGAHNATEWEFVQGTRFGLVDDGLNADALTAQRPEVELVLPWGNGDG